jgi:hypothetical protein
MMRKAMEDDRPPPMHGFLGKSTEMVNQTVNTFTIKLACLAG